jgi:hypothetical protein
METIQFDDFPNLQFVWLKCWDNTHDQDTDYEYKVGFFVNDRDEIVVIDRFAKFLIGEDRDTCYYYHYGPIVNIDDFNDIVNDTFEIPVWTEEPLEDEIPPNNSNISEHSEVIQVEEIPESKQTKITFTI